MSESRHVQHRTALEERLAQEAKELRRRAKTLPSGLKRESLLQKAERNETAIQMSEWLRPNVRSSNRTEADAVYAMLFAAEK